MRLSLPVRDEHVCRINRQPPEKQSRAVKLLLSIIRPTQCTHVASRLRHFENLGMLYTGWHESSCHKAWLHLDGWQLHKGNYQVCSLAHTHRSLTHWWHIVLRPHPPTLLRWVCDMYLDSVSMLQSVNLVLIHNLTWALVSKVRLRNVGNALLNCVHE